MSLLNLYKQFYIQTVPGITFATTIIGATTGLIGVKFDELPLKHFTTLIGFTSLGTITGILYPITLPMLAGYVIFKKNN
jgi:hypothetical protein